MSSASNSFYYKNVQYISNKILCQGPHMLFFSWLLNLYISHLAYVVIYLLLNYELDFKITVVEIIFESFNM